MTMEMRGASRTSLDALRRELGELLTDPAVDAGALGEALFAATHLLDRQPSLRRALSDPAAEPERKSGLAEAVFSGPLGATAVRLLQGVVRSRWSSSRSLTDALEVLAVDCLVTQAERDGELDELEDELFRFERIVEGEHELHRALTNGVLPDERKGQLVEALLGGKVTREALRLDVEAVTHPRARTVEGTLTYYGQLLADHRRGLVATVRSAVALTEEERERLAAALRRQYGREVRVNVEVDPSVLGGMRVQVGSDLIDGTIARRLDDARRRLAG